MKVKELQPKQGNVTIELDIVEKEEPRTFNKFGKEGRVCNATAKDSSGQIKLTGFIPRKDAFAYKLASDLLLLVIGTTSQEGLSTYGLSGKTYDYILTGKPILALAQEGGATFNFLKKYLLLCSLTRRDSATLFCFFPILNFESK